MSEPFLGQITIFAGNYAIRGWAFCDGQLLAIAQNTALFSLLGTIYGGDGRTTFGLPDLRGRAPMHWGQGPGLSPRQIGQKSGTETETLPANQMPVHSHILLASESGGTQGTPWYAVPAGTPSNTYGTPGNLVKMAEGTMTTTGGEPHNNMQPYLTLNFLIALTGIYPPRS